MKPFENPEQKLASLDPVAAGGLLATAADLSLVVDAHGEVVDVAIGDAELLDRGIEDWVGTPLIGTVSDDTRHKITELLADAPVDRPGNWRQINHLATPTGAPDIPVSYAAMRMHSGDGNFVLIGRNLAAIAGLQQRLIEAQQTLERDYSRIRMAETRYRLLFQTTAESVLVVDANTEKVLEANPATRELLGDSGRGIVGKRLLECFDTNATQALGSLLSTVRGTGRPSEVRVHLHETQRTLIVGAAMFRQDASPCFLVRISLPEGPLSTAESSDAGHFMGLIEHATEAFLVTDQETNVLVANPAFADLAQLATPEQARGRALESWLGRPGVDVNVLLSHLRQHGSVRYFQTSLRPEIGPPVQVELAAVRLRDPAAPGYGFTIRSVVRSQSAGASPASGQEVPRSVEQLTELVGRVPLKELVRETTDVIERMCIEAALKLTEDNRASAAEMLGLSRQSLYVKLRRYGLGDLATEGDPDA